MGTKWVLLFIGYSVYIGVLLLHIRISNKALVCGPFWFFAVISRTNVRQLQNVQGKSEKMTV